MPERGDQMEEDDALRKIFIGGLNPITNRSTLLSHFGPWKPRRVRIWLDPKSKGFNKGIASLLFDNPEVVDHVLAARPHMIDGKVVNVRRPLPAKEIGHLHAMVPTTKILASSLSPDTCEGDLAKHFAKYGRVSSVDVPVKENLPFVNRGFGLVCFEDADSVDKLMLCSNEHCIKGKFLTVRRAFGKAEVVQVHELIENVMSRKRQAELDTIRKPGNGNGTKVTAEVILDESSASEEEEAEVFKPKKPALAPAASIAEKREATTSGNDLGKPALQSVTGYHAEKGNQQKPFWTEAFLVSRSPLVAATNSVAQDDQQQRTGIQPVKGPRPSRLVGRNTPTCSERETGPDVNRSMGTAINQQLPCMPSPIHGRSAGTLPMKKDLLLGDRPTDGQTRPLSFPQPGMVAVALEPALAAVEQTEHGPVEENLQILASTEDGGFWARPSRSGGTAPKSIGVHQGESIGQKEPRTSLPVGFAFSPPVRPSTFKQLSGPRFLSPTQPTTTLPVVPSTPVRGHIPRRATGSGSPHSPVMRPVIISSKSLERLKAPQQQSVDTRPQGSEEKPAEMLEAPQQSIDQRPQGSEWKPASPKEVVLPVHAPVVAVRPSPQPAVQANSPPHVPQQAYQQKHDVRPPVSVAAVPDFTEDSWLDYIARGPPPALPFARPQHFPATLSPMANTHGQTTSHQAMMAPQQFSSPRMTAGWTSGTTDGSRPNFVPPGDGHQHAGFAGAAYPNSYNWNGRRGNIRPFRRGTNRGRILRRRPQNQ